MTGSAAMAASQDAPAADGFARAHAQLLADHDLQFSFTSIQLQPIPAWFKPLAQLLAAIAKLIAPVLQWLFWLGLAAIVAAVLYFIAREIIRQRWPGRRKGAAIVLQPEWRPEPARARALLEDADRMAEQGLYTEAAHLLLFRSIEDIDGRRPRLVRPALTARDIARLQDLPATAAAAFSIIAQAVERSIFGGRGLDSEAFAECRRAYEAFAFPEAWA